MPNYFYIDANGQKHGLVNDQQLQALAAQGVITPNTPLETEGGHKGTAGQIPGLQFTPQTAEQTTYYSPQNRTHSQGNVTVAGSIMSWLLDFAFRDLRLPVINLWACRIMYVIGCIAAIFGGIVMSFELFYIAGETSGGSVFIGIPLTWLGVAFLIIAARLLCEWYIIVFDWIVETTKAARIYSENNERE